MIFIVMTTAVIALIFFSIRANNRWLEEIQSNPSLYSKEELDKDPTGEDVYIEAKDGTQIRAKCAGEGPTVVLAHCYGMSMREWNIIWQMLIDKGYRVISWDHRGHGKTRSATLPLSSHVMAEDYLTVLQHFNVTDSILVGHSMGGFLSIIFQLNYPEEAAKHLRGFVMFASTAGNVLKGAPQNQLQIPLMRMGIIQKICASKNFSWHFGASIFGDNPSPNAIQAFNTSFLEQNHRALTPVVTALSNEDYYPRLPEIKTPCVVISGEKDNTCPEWHGITLHASLPNARRVIVPGCGHMLNWESPESLVSAIASLREPVTDSVVDTHPHIFVNKSVNY